MLRVALISSSPLVLAGLRAGLEQAEACVVVLASPSLSAARQEGLAEADVLIVDGDDELVDLLLADRHDGGPAVVLLTDGQADEVGDWLERGVTVLPGNASPELVAAAAVAAGAGLVASSPALTSQALRFARIGESKRLDIDMEPLTPREQQVLVKMVSGLGNREIADALHVSPHTAKFHVAQIISKLNANSRAHAVAKALQAGLLEG
jgi:DNA-binding NarL/FixJ family response regulator